MKRPWLSRALLIAAIGGGAILLGQPVWATDTDLPTTARAFAQNHLACDITGGGPFADRDVWIFATEKGRTGATVSFSRPGSVEPQIRAIEPDDGVAWVRTPAGWTLTAATPGVALTGTCPARGPSADTQAAPVNPMHTRALPTRAPALSGAPVAQTAASLPNTGLDVAGMVTLGSTMVVAGALLLIVRRRPDPPPAIAPEPMVWVRSTHDRSGEVVIHRTRTPR